jgi:hypothetical protein
VRVPTDLLPAHVLKRCFVQFNAALLDIKLSGGASPGILNAVSQ